MKFESDIRRFIDDNCVLGVEADSLDLDTSLTEAGVIDSMAVLELIMYLEERFDILIPDSELIPENLDSISRIVAYLDRKIVEKAGNDSNRAVSSSSGCRAGAS